VVVRPTNLVRRGCHLKFGSPNIDDMALLCHCHEVTDRAIRAAVHDGARSLTEVADVNLATTSCGGCTDSVCRVIDSTLLGLLTGASAQH
jgi:NAD(P)H-nitrite reductase large subunit